MADPVLFIVVLFHLLHKGHLLLFLQILINDRHIREHQLLSFLNLLLHQLLKLLLCDRSNFLVVHVDSDLLHGRGPIVSRRWQYLQRDGLENVRLVIQYLSFGLVRRCTSKLPFIPLLLLYIADSLVRIGAEVEVRA